MRSCWAISKWQHAGCPLHPQVVDIESCVANLTRAVELDEDNRELGQTDPDPEWARQDERVKKLLGLS